MEFGKFPLKGKQYKFLGKQEEGISEGCQGQIMASIKPVLSLAGLA